MKGGVQKWVWYSEKAKKLHSQNATAPGPLAFTKSVDSMASRHNYCSQFLSGGGNWRAWEQGSLLLACLLPVQNSSTHMSFAWCHGVGQLLKFIAHIIIAYILQSTQDMTLCNGQQKRLS